MEFIEIQINIFFSLKEFKLGEQKCIFNNGQPNSITNRKVAT